MTLSQELKYQIVKSLEPLEPYKIILFGSYAWGEPTKDSDIDLVFIDNKSGFFASFMDRVNVKKEILKKLISIDSNFDIINYQRAEWEMLLKDPNQFIKKIANQGIILEK